MIRCARGVVIAAVASSACVSALAGNLIVNGSFEQVNPDPVSGPEIAAGFFTDYYLDSSDGMGQYGSSIIANSGYGHAGIVENAQAWHGSFHNFGAQDGDKFLIVNGAGADMIVWEQYVSGANPGTTYEFSFWARNAYPTNPANIDISAYIGNTLLANFTANLAQSNPSPTGQWVKFSAMWTGLGDPTQITLIDNTESFDGDDFAIDNIRLDAIVPLPQHMGAVGLMGLLAMRRRRMA